MRGQFSASNSLAPWTRAGCEGSISLYFCGRSASTSIRPGTPTTLFTGNCIELISRVPDASIDLTITSPPYCMGREYDTSNSVEDFIAAHKVILPEIV